MNQHGNHRRIDTARQAKDHFIVTHLFFDASNRIFDDGFRRPQTLTATHAQNKVLQHL
ncbi:Uncharacterised protein [Vibrio cholerae]|nr:Uncharacterised protein [Vibrio cholerae]CSC53088.1 Uncharacterised protein [Vibrio cholerae]CSI96253.1 Uncharacterised protein [Vibrio cholerae]